MSKVKTKPFDPAEYLDDDESIAAYMTDALESGDPSFVADALGVAANACVMNPPGAVRKAGDCALVMMTTASPSSPGLAAALSGNTRPQSAGVFSMAGHAQRLEVLQMVRAGQLRVLSGARHDVVDLEPRDLLCRPPRPHRREVRTMRRMFRPQRTFRAARAAPSTAVAVAPLHRGPRNRPPMIRPERIAAPVATP